MLTILKDAASIPLSLYVKVSLFASVADTALPMFVPAVVFSAMVRVAVVPSVKIGATFMRLNISSGC